MATHSIILAWRIPWTKEPGKLQSIGLHSVCLVPGLQSLTQAWLWGSTGAALPNAHTSHHATATLKITSFNSFLDISLGNDFLTPKVEWTHETSSNFLLLQRKPATGQKGLPLNGRKYRKSYS